MGVEFTGFSLLDVYAKQNPNKISQKFGQELIVKVQLPKSSIPSKTDSASNDQASSEDPAAANQTLIFKRQIVKNPHFKEKKRNTEDDIQE
jgi:hypothetical protein